MQLRSLDEEPPQQPAVNELQAQQRRRLGLADPPNFRHKRRPFDFET